MERERNEGGQYTEQVKLEHVLGLFDRVEVPVLTSSEVAEKLDIARPTAYQKLETLADEGKLHKKKVGGRAAVYIHPERLTDPSENADL